MKAPKPDSQSISDDLVTALCRDDRMTVMASPERGRAIARLAFRSFGLDEIRSWQALRANANADPDTAARASSLATYVLGLAAAEGVDPEIEPEAASERQRAQLPATEFSPEEQDALDGQALDDSCLQALDDLQRRAATACQPDDDHATGLPLWVGPRRIKAPEPS